MKAKYGSNQIRTERDMPYAKYSPQRENAVAASAAVPSLDKRLG